MTFKIYITIKGDDQSDLARKLSEILDVENEQEEDGCLRLTAWSKSFPLDRLIDESARFSDSEMTVDVLQDTIGMRCTIVNEKVVWEHEVDYDLDNDPTFASLIERTDEGHPVIPAIVPDADTVSETLRFWGWTAHEVVVREYTEDEISELGLVTYPQMRTLVESA
jgi:hypothetical protein